MIHSHPSDKLKDVDFSISEMIEWGYETSGDFDEALRVYTEMAALAGFNVQYTETELQRAREDFKLEFGDKQWDN
jgi:hypothetical protein